MKLSQIPEGKFLYRLPVNHTKSNHRVDLTYGEPNGKPEKHKVIRIKQTLLNKKFGDRRQLRHVIEHTNPNNETFLFADYGTGKNRIMVTIGQVIGKNWLMMDLS